MTEHVDDDNPDDPTVRAWLSGDQDALPRLLEKHYRFVRLFVRLRVDPATRLRESTSDIVQSVCREVLVRADRFEYRGEAAFRSWLCEAALRKLRDRWKHNRAQRRDPKAETPLVDREGHLLELADAYRTTLDPVGRAMRAEEIERLEATFDELSDAQREAMTLRYVAGLDYAEIASRTGRTQEAVRQAVRRARVFVADRMVAAS